MDDDLVGGLFDIKTSRACLSNLDPISDVLLPARRRGERTASETNGNYNLISSKGAKTRAVATWNEYSGVYKMVISRLESQHTSRHAESGAMIGNDVSSYCTKVDKSVSASY